MRIAIIGGGIAGMACAWLLSKQHAVTLYEQHGRLGGHTDTHRIELGGKHYCVDTGFIVMNPGHYRLFSALLAELGVGVRETQMTFSVRNEASGLEYNADSLRGLFVQKRRLASPRHWRMLADIVRFYRAAPALLEGAGPGPSIGEYLDANGYSAGFRDDHLLPMTSALWSMAHADALGFPARYLVAFMANHQMLKLSDRAPWQTIVGGSQRYVEALLPRLDAQLRLGAPVRSVVRDAGGVRVLTDADEQHFDQVILACHSDQALAMLAAPSEAEVTVLSALRFAQNETVLHTDARLLPRDRRAWAAWNARVPAQPQAACTVSYCMNILQGLDAPEPLIVSLNAGSAIDPAKVLKRRRYAHPQYSHESVAAQGRRGEINGVDRIWYAGAYWGFGFHEDGIRSAVDVAGALGVAWPQ